MTASPPQLFDRPLHRRRLARAAGTFAGADFLWRRAAEDIVERLDAIRRTFPRAILLGDRQGLLARAIEDGGRPGQVGELIRADLSAEMLSGAEGPRVVADEERLPFQEGCADLVVSVLSLHWVNDLVGALIQARRALKPDGLFLGILLGGASLHELRHSLTQAELDLRGGAGPRVSPFIDAADAGDLMRRAGFALPVIDVDRVTVRYPDPLALMADLRAMGQTNVLRERSNTPLTRPLLARAREIYLESFADGDGRVPATFEIIVLTGWAPHPDQPAPLKRGSATARLEDALRRVRGEAEG